jgi:uncharacterized protein
VEITSGLARLAREGALDGPRMAKATAQVRALREQWIEVQPSERVREIALVLLERHALTAADGLQLAAAVVWANERPKSRVFLCLDRRLADAAGKEGFDVAP